MIRNFRQSPPNKPAKQQGFTLIEAVIAMAVFSVGVLAVATMQYKTVSNTTVGNRMTDALSLAYSEMERIKSTANLSTLSSEYNDTGLTVTGASGGVFNRHITVTDAITHPGNSSDMTRLIRVTVSYPVMNTRRTFEVQCLTQGGGV